MFYFLDSSKQTSFTHCWLLQKLHEVVTSNAFQTVLKESSISLLDVFHLLCSQIHPRPSLLGLGSDACEGQVICCITHHHLHRLLGQKFLHSMEVCLKCNKEANNSTN